MKAYNISTIGFILASAMTILSSSIYAHEGAPTSVNARTQVHAEHEDIESVLMSQQVAWNNGDIKGFMSGYWHSKELRFASGDQITYGWEETYARYLKRYSDKKIMGQLRFDILSIKKFSETDAQVFGRWTLTREQDVPSGLFTLTFKKIQGLWQITEDHTSSK